MSSGPAPPPRLRVIEPAALRGQVISLMDGWTTVGREEGNMRLTDPRVSKRHAVLYASGGLVTIEDAGSTAGTRVNGQIIQGRQPVRLGDILGFGPVLVRYEVEPALPALPANIAPAAGGSFVVGTQRADQLNNVARDQYNSYLHTVIQQRDSFLREVAGARTRARRIVWFGLILFAGGGAVEIAAAIVFARQFGSVTQDSDTDSFFRSFGVAYAAGGVCALGIIITIVGIIMHVSATSRQRRVAQSYPIRPP